MVLVGQVSMMGEMRGLAWMLLIGPLMAGPKEDFARGVLEEERGSSGSEWFDKALDRDPDAWPLVERVAGDRMREGDIEAASTLYREYAVAYPQRLEAQLTYVDFLRESSPGDDFAAKLASETLERTLKDHPDDLAVIRRLFRSYEQRGLRDRSMALFDQLASDEGSGNALAAAEMARTLFPADDEAAQAKVDAVYRKAVERSPGDPLLARRASEHFRSSGRLKEAIEVLRKHVEANPGSLDLRVRLGILFFAAKEDADGERCLMQVLEIDSRQALAHRGLAKYYRKNEETEKARPHAIEVLKLRGGDVDEFTELAQELLDLEQPREARLLLEKGLFDHPDDADIAVKLAIATRRDESTRERAAWRFREAEALSGTDGPATDPAFQLEFAEHLMRVGQSKSAEIRLRSAIKSYPPEAKEETASTLRRLAKIWIDEGRNEAAAQALLKRAEGLDPQEE